MSDKNHIHAEIAYMTANGPVHSDVCSSLIDDVYRQLLHECLDEFLNNYEPSGIFAVGSFRHVNNHKHNH